MRYLWLFCSLSSIVLASPKLASQDDLKLLHNYLTPYESELTHFPLSIIERDTTFTKHIVLLVAERIVDHLGERFPELRPDAIDDRILLKREFVLETGRSG